LSRQYNFRNSAYD